MTGKTHKAGGMLCSIIGFSLLRNNNLLLPNINEGLQWLVMYPFCMWGSVASDLDHHWDSCPMKDYPSRVINILLHLGKPLEDKGLKIAHILNAKHRSWQTHSDLTLIAMLYLLFNVTIGKFNYLGEVNCVLISLVLMGVSLGIIAHFILDAITPEGIWLVGMVTLNRIFKVINIKVKLPEKVHLVPKSKFFATGGAWETAIQKVLQICTTIAVIWFLAIITRAYWSRFL